MTKGPARLFQKRLLNETLVRRLSLGISRGLNDGPAPRFCESLADHDPAMKANSRGHCTDEHRDRGGAGREGSDCRSGTESCETPSGAEKSRPGDQARVEVGSLWDGEGRS